MRWPKLGDRLSSSMKSLPRTSTAWRIVFLPENSPDLVTWPMKATMPLVDLAHSVSISVQRTGVLPLVKPLLYLPSSRVCSESCRTKICLFGFDLRR